MGPKTRADQLSCRQVSSQRIFPAAPLRGERKSVGLSILDATVANFSPCAAIWLYDPTEASMHTDQLIQNLRQTLSETLDDYPHFAGQLRWTADSDTDNSELLPAGAAAVPKLGRPVVSYGGSDSTEGEGRDPGVNFTVATGDCPLSALVPSEEERRKGGNKNVWIATDFPQDDLLPRCELAFASSLGKFEGLPGASVQVTTFSCGGFAVGIRITHCLSDAVCLVQLAKKWAGRSKRLFSSGKGNNEDDGTERAAVVFAPHLLDCHAGIDGERKHVADQEKIQRARSLPMHRYDWWKDDAPGYPSWARTTSEAMMKPPNEKLFQMKLSPSTRPPWTTWDLSKPVDHVQIRFGGDEVRRMREAAQAGLATQEGAPVVISRLDALLAHVWILINRARRPTKEEDDDDDAEEEDEEVYMDITLGLRTRVAPPLPETFVGSPILLTNISRPASIASQSASLGDIAMSIRSTMTLFTSQAVSAYLHDAAHEISPQRLWQAFLGRQHTLVTSWTRAGCYEVDFVGDGRRPVYVQGRMPRMDGLLQIMDDVGEDGDGYDVSVCLEREAVRRLVADGRLRAFDGYIVP